jgi:hypothetical protein
VLSATFSIPQVLRTLRLLSEDAFSVISTAQYEISRIFQTFGLFFADFLLKEHFFPKFFVPLPLVPGEIGTNNASLLFRA